MSKYQIQELLDKGKIEFLEKHWYDMQVTEEQARIINR